MPSAWRRQVVDAVISDPGALTAHQLRQSDGVFQAHCGRCALDERRFARSRGRRCCTSHERKGEDRYRSQAGNIPE